MKRVSIVVLTIAMVFIGCNQTVEQVLEPKAFVNVSIQGLPRLQSGEGRYELWANFFELNKRAAGSAILHSEIELIAAFNIGPDGTIVDMSDVPMEFSIPEEKNPQLLDEAFVVLRRDGETGGPAAEDVPPGSIILAGSFTGDEALTKSDLSFSFAKAFGTSFSEVKGTYSIQTPTSAAVIDSLSGVWFYRQDIQGPSLQFFPVLPEGWVYEGWVVFDSGGVVASYSTGKFARVDSADFDGAGPGRGPLAGLNVPGQDFIVGNPSHLNLTSPGYSFMITLEPWPDNSPNPSSIILLSSQPIAIVDSPTVRDGELVNWSLTTQPRASIRVRR